MITGGSKLNTWRVIINTSSTLIVKALSRPRPTGEHHILHILKATKTRGSVREALQGNMPKARGERARISGSWKVHKAKETRRDTRNMEGDERRRYTPWRGRWKVRKENERVVRFDGATPHPRHVNSAHVGQKFGAYRCQAAEEQQQSRISTSIKSGAPRPQQPHDDESSGHGANRRH